jgi:hypothetical protein
MSFTLGGPHISIHRSVNYFPGTDGVLALFKYLERKLLGKSPKNLSRTSSVLSFGCGLDRYIHYFCEPDEPIVAYGYLTVKFRDFVEVIEGRSSPDMDGTRRRTNSQGSKTPIQVINNVYFRVRIYCQRLLR